MTRSGRKLTLKWRRGDETILIVSLLLAVFIWLAHNLSDDFFSYRQFRVTVVTDIDGYAPTSVADQILSVGGRAKGFDLISQRASARHPKDVTINLDAALFVPDKSAPNTFSVAASDMQKALDAAAGSDFSVTVLPDVRVSFVFEPQSFKKVPVDLPVVEISCQPQYMMTGELTLTPDSVFVYGNEKDLVKVSSVTARPLRLQNIDRNTVGELQLNKVPGMRIGSGTVSYKIAVARYVEERVTVNITPVNVPAGKKLIVLPSTVDLVCRIPYDAVKRLSADDFSFVLDYNDVVSLHSSKVIPRMASSGCTVLSYETVPAMVDFIIAED